MAACAAAVGISGPPALAATLGVKDGVLTLDASADTASSEISLFSDTIDDMFVFTASGVEAGPGCAPLRSSVACLPDGISALLVRGPTNAPAEIHLDTVDRGPGGPAITGAVDAGAKDDRIDTHNDISDRVSCGPGYDSIRADASDKVEADCERWRALDVKQESLLPGTDLRLRPQKKIGRGDSAHPYGVTFRITCPQTTPDDSCGGRLDLFAAEPPSRRVFLGNGTYSLVRGRTQRFVVLLGFGALDGRGAGASGSGNYLPELRRLQSAITKRGRARMYAQVRSGSSRFGHPFTVVAIDKR